MSPETLADRCALLRRLHVKGSPLVLPNAWDAGSARAVVKAGFPVVATTSGGVALALGFEDHEGAPRDEMTAAAARIVNAVDVPVTVDFEAGYGLEPGAVVELLQSIGVAGCNLEDTDHRTGQLRPVAAQAQWLADVRTAAEAIGYSLVVNARIDVFLVDRSRPQGEVLDAALERSRAYAAAGVDCVYPIFMIDAQTRRAFVSGSPGPVNVLAWPGVEDAAELGADGVARISYGSRLHTQSMRHLADDLATIRAG